ncbi:MAG TPA: fumarylacetoacetase [Acidimicrobiales bacterium]|nr:fumarylacetoacetase [Acidimicrobiales bacterium]
MTARQERPPWVPVPEGSLFPLSNLPYGSFSVETPHSRRGLGVAIGEFVLDLSAAARATRTSFAELVAGPVLNPLMAAGPRVWSEVRDTVTNWLVDPALQGLMEPHLVPRESVALHLPFEVGDYVDFYSSEHHAANAGRILRPGTDPLPPQWKHLPIGYHGRAGTIVVSGTPVRRPFGQVRRDPGTTVPDFRRSQALDIEAEVGFVVGVPSLLGRPVPVSEFDSHVFGVVILNDWSARDIQAWEYVPLGPFLGKSFLTSVSPWVVPMAALEAARMPPPPRTPEPLPYLDDTGIKPALDIRLEVALNGQVISRPPFSAMYWTAAQQMAHLTSNGASLRTGDLYASGTVSGPDPDQVGSLLEMSWGGSKPFVTPDGVEHTYLADGDEVSIAGYAPAVGGGILGFGDVRGRVE